MQRNSCCTKNRSKPMKQIHSSSPRSDNPSFSALIIPQFPRLCNNILSHTGNKCSSFRSAARHTIIIEQVVAECTPRPRQRSGNGAFGHAAAFPHLTHRQPIPIVEQEIFSLACGQFILPSKSDRSPQSDSFGCILRFGAEFLTKLCDPARIKRKARF